MQEERRTSAVGQEASDEGENIEVETPKESAETSFPPFPSQVKVPEAPVPEESPKMTVLPTTIEGGMVLTNRTELQLDLNAIIEEAVPQKLLSEGPQILIIHTHGSEAYTPEKDQNYVESDPYRTQDPQYSVIRIGDELTACFESYGLSVIHDTGIYDYPSYNGSYIRSGEVVEKYLQENPTISIVLDVHRDAIGTQDVIYKTLAEDGGKVSSQVMLLVGSDVGGLHYPLWKQNLRLALYLQSAVLNKYPTLMRPIALTKSRYNQQLSTGSILVEVGSSGNTLDEALRAIRNFADAVGPALLELVENS